MMPAIERGIWAEARNDDDLWNFGNWLVDEGLLRTCDETPDDKRSITQLINDFRRRQK